MTLEDIIKGVLAQLGYECDPETIETYREEITRHVNAAQDDIAQHIRMTRTETLYAELGVINIHSLSRRCLGVNSVVQLGHKVLFRKSKHDANIYLPYELEAEVTYVYLPNKLLDLHDTLELPNYTYPLILAYVIGNIMLPDEFLSGIYFSMYYTAKEALIRKGR